MKKLWGPPWSPHRFRWSWFWHALVHEVNWYGDVNGPFSGSGYSRCECGREWKW